MIKVLVVYGMGGRRAVSRYRTSGVRFASFGEVPRSHCLAVDSHFLLLLSSFFFFFFFVACQLVCEGNEQNKDVCVVGNLGPTSTDCRSVVGVCVNCDIGEKCVATVEFQIDVVRKDDDDALATGKDLLDFVGDIANVTLVGKPTLLVRPGTQPE